MENEMETIKIWNMHNGSTARMIKVDRSSALGNPFYMGKEEDRDEVCNKYISWLWKKMKEGKNYQTRELGNLYAKWGREGELILACWCAPRRCHAESIRKALIWMKSLTDLPTKKGEKS